MPRRTSGLFALALLLASPELAPAAPPCTGSFTDDFGDGSLAPLWANASGANGSAAETGGRLVMSKSAGIVGAAACVMANPNVLCGDFDAQVDFDLGSFPAASVGSGRFHAMSIVDATTDALLAGGERYREQANGCIPFTDSYKFYTTVPGCSPTAIYTATGDSQGKLRLVRQGTAIRGYYWNGSSWTEVMNRTIGTGWVKIRFTSGTNGTLTTGHVAYFDNLVVVSSPLAPGSTPWGLLALAGAMVLAGAGMARRPSRIGRPTA